MRTVMLAAFAVLFIACPVFAQAVAPSVGVPMAPVTGIPVDTIVTVPIGSWANTALGYLSLGLGSLVVWGFRLLPAQLYALAMTMRADQLMTKALSYALNVAGTAVQNKVWTIDTRNQVLKDIATYVIVHGADAVKTFIGTPADMAEKGFARITGAVDASGNQQPNPLPAGPKPDFAAIGAQAQAAASTEAINRT